MTAYNKEQFEALKMVRRFLHGISPEKRGALSALAEDYLGFRERFGVFSEMHFSDPCRVKCYETGKSLCCAKEGIIAYFADVFVNALVADEKELDLVATALAEPRGDDRCVFLGQSGCLWKIKPIVCEMFICDPVMEQVVSEDPEAGKTLEELSRERKGFTWPDRPVFFDRVEALFMDAGFDSPIMYLHKSPGLLRVKQRAGGKNRA